MLVVYEDEGYRDLFPLTCLRPVFDLLCGRRTLLQKVQAFYPSEPISLLVRPELKQLEREAQDRGSRAIEGTAGSRRQDRAECAASRVLFLSGRAIMERALPVSGPEQVFVCGDEILGFRTDARRVKSAILTQATVRKWRLPECRVLASIVRYPWDLISLNETELARELGRPDRRNHRRTRTDADRRIQRTGSRPPPFNVIGDAEGLSLARSALVQPGAVFDLTRGRVLIDERAEIRAGSVIAGPCYVGKGTIIDAARVRPGCSFGPNCRIGGEVEASIFIGSANKHHEGFIGHSVIGEWVNLGALTTNSDLRNDYGEVRVTMRGRLINSQMRKVGSIIGDHAKTAIGSLLNTGTCMGIFANWFEPGLSPKVIPSFAWGRSARGRLDDVLATARIVMGRRGVEMTPAYERLVRRCYDAEK